MSEGPNFVEFAAIQLFAAMVCTPRAGTKWEEDAVEAWRLAKLLYDSKPIEQKPQEAQTEIPTSIPSPRKSNEF